MEFSKVRNLKENSSYCIGCLALFRYIDYDTASVSVLANEVIGYLDCSILATQ